MSKEEHIIVKSKTSANISFINTALKLTDNSNPHLIWLKGVMLIIRKNYEEASQCFVELESKKYENAKVWHQFTQYLIENNLGKAIVCLDGIENIYSTNAEFFYLKGINLYKLDRIKDSIEYLNRAEYLGINVHNRTYFYSDMLSMLMNLDKFDEAINYCVKLLEIDSNNLDTIYHKVYALHKLGQNEEAKQFASKQIVYLDKEVIECLYDKSYKEYKYSQYNYNVGNLFVSMNCLAEALQYFQKALTFAIEKTDKANITVSMGNVSYKLGKYKDVQKYFDQAEKLGKDDSDFYYSKGDLLYELGEYNQALAYYHKVEDCGINSAELYKAYGNVSWKLGKKEIALANYHEAEKLGMHTIELYGSIATLCSSLGDDKLEIYGKKYYYKTASDYYDKSLRIEPYEDTFTDKQSVQVKLEELGEIKQVKECTKKIEAFKTQKGLSELFDSFEPSKAVVVYEPDTPVINHEVSNESGLGIIGNCYIM